MNKKKYDSLPADVRKAIDDTTGDALAAKFGDWWNAWDAPGLEAARKKGNVITSLTDAERARWRAALKPTIDKLLGDLEKQGVTNARAIYTEKIGRASCRERVCQYV